MEENFSNTSKPEPTETPSESPIIVSTKPKLLIFSLFLYVVIFSNFDTGVIPAALPQIKLKQHLSQVEQAALGSLPFFGISFGSLLVSFFMKRLTTIRTLFLALFLNILSSVWFALSYDLVSMYIARFLMGFTQSFWVVYGPVWTNQYSPSKYHTTWLGILQGFSPMGIMFGYLLTGIIVNNWASEFSWRLGVLIQAVGEAPILLAFFWLENKDVDILELKQETEEGKEEKPLCKKKRSHFGVLVRNFVFISGVSTNCVAFFVVFGLQFWGTLYIIDVLKEDSSNAMIAYSFLTITAPFLGVFAGGYFSDRLGGYKGKQVLTALKFCVVFSFISATVGLISSFVSRLMIWTPLVWLQIFLGACLIPPGSGVVVNSVEREYQTSASGFAQLVYNILGYFMSPLFSALIMDSFDNRIEGMVWG